MLHELRQLILAALDREIEAAVERVLHAANADEERLHGRVGYANGLRRAREVVVEVCKDNLRSL